MQTIVVEGWLVTFTLAITLKLNEWLVSWKWA